MTQPLDDLYIEWLYGQLGGVRTKAPSRTYWSLIKKLLSTEFIWIIPNDDNRVEDGRDLRAEFIEAHQLKNVSHDWLGLGCSVLEMLIGVARRLSFEAEGTTKWWFWKLIENLKLDVCTDNYYDERMERGIDEILERLIWRTYARNGEGGLFPLRRPPRDQRRVEIWYQLSAYILERQ